METPPLPAPSRWAAELGFQPESGWLESWDFLLQEHRLLGHIQLPVVSEASEVSVRLEER